MKRTTWARREDEAPHQIRLFWSKRGKHGNVDIAVGCTCRPGRFGGNSYEVLGHLDDTADSPWPIFNDPANHKHDPHPFTEEHQGGSVNERLTAPPAPVHGTVAGPVLAELDAQGVEDRRRPDLHRDLLHV